MDALKARMQALGMRPVVRTDGSLEGQVPFRNLTNAFTRSAILAATVRNFGEDAVVCVTPAHLAHIPAIKILALPDMAAYEAQVHALCQRRLQKLQEANEFLATIKLPAELDEPGFRVVSEVWVGDDVVRFTLRQGNVVQVLSIAGRSLDVVVDPRDRRIDAKKVRTSAALVRLLEPLIQRLRGPMAGAGRVSVEAEDTREFQRRTAAAVPAVAKRAQNELFDHTFGVLAAEDPSQEDTFGGIVMPPVTESQQSPASDEAPMIALVCKACGSFYLVAENPSDARLLDTCPRCLGLAS